MNRRPARSCSWKSSGILSRPVASHSSTGVSTGANHSCEPIASISSRMICSTLRCTRQPSGVNDHRPALTCRMNPARTSSLWLTASASAGASRSVGRYSCEARAIEPRAIIVGVRGYLLERDRGCLGHRERGRLRVLPALRALHARLDPGVDLAEELVDEDLRLDLPQHLAVRVDEADVAAAGDAEVGVARLAGPVDGAAEDGDLEVLRVRTESLLDLLGECLHADVVAAAARARD